MESSEINRTYTEWAGEWDAPQVRSALFVPANRADLMVKALRTDADALILDLEDSVPETAEEKENALQTLVRWLDEQSPHPEKLLTVRINARSDGRLWQELDALIGAGITVFMLPKVESPDDIEEMERVVTYLEGKHVRPLGSTVIWPMPETVKGIRLAYEIASSSRRIRFMGAGIAAGGDMARELGCVPTASGLESLYLRSKVLLDVRSAGVRNPLTGVVTEINDLSVVESFAKSARELGYEGMMLIHPSHVAPANAAFSPTEAELEDARGLLAVLVAAEGNRSAAVTYKGKMVDIAMKKSAESLVRRHGSR